MPNWCSNKLEIHGSAEKILRVKNHIGFDTEVIDFNRIVPMPPALHITSGSSTSHAISVLKGNWEEWLSFPLVADKFMGIYGKKPSSREELIEMLEALPLQPETLGRTAKTTFFLDLAEGRTALNNEKEYGYRDWYSFANNEWGTKWNACDPVCHTGQVEHLCIYFDTAWAPPIPVIDRLMMAFPDVRFRLAYLETGCGFCGVLDEDGDQDMSNDIKSFSIEEFGYDELEYDDAA